MALDVVKLDASRPKQAHIYAVTERPWARYTLLAVAIGFMALFIVLPLIAVFVEALRRGPGEFLASLVESDA